MDFPVAEEQLQSELMFGVLDSSNNFINNELLMTIHWDWKEAVFMTKQTLSAYDAWSGSSKIRAQQNTSYQHHLEQALKFTHNPQLCLITATNKTFWLMLF